MQALTAKESQTAWQPFVADGEDRLLSALVVDGLQGEDEAGLSRARGILEAIPGAACLSFDGPEAGVLWRVVLPLSAQIRLTKVPSRAWSRACWLVERWLTQLSGLESRTPVEQGALRIHVDPQGFFLPAPKGARTSRGKRPVNLEGMVGDRGLGGIGSLRVESDDLGVVLFIGPVGYHITSEEAADIAEELWRYAPEDRKRPRFVPTRSS